MLPHHPPYQRHLARHTKRQLAPAGMIAIVAAAAIMFGLAFMAGCDSVQTNSVADGLNQYADQAQLVIDDYHKFNTPIDQLVAALPADSDIQNDLKNVIAKARSVGADVIDHIQKSIQAARDTATNLKALPASEQKSVAHGLEGLTVVVGEANKQWVPAPFQGMIAAGLVIIGGIVDVLRRKEKAKRRTAEQVTQIIVQSVEAGKSDDGKTVDLEKVSAAMPQPTKDAVKQSKLKLAA